MKHDSPKFDVYEKVTNDIIAALEAGTRPWAPTWKRGSSPIAMPLRVTGEPYRGINVLLLWSAGAARGYASSTWMTYKQAQELGGQVRKGESGSLVCYAGATGKSDSATAVSTEADETAADDKRVIRFMKSYVVFNTDQIDGLPAQYLAACASPPTTGMEAHAGRFIAACGAKIRTGPNPLYQPSTDLIDCPAVGDFATPADHAATLLHELIHWTGAGHRLKRETGTRFGDNAYAFEELVAEIGAAMVCSKLGIGDSVREENAAYIAAWLEILKKDKRAIMAAARLAQNAVEFLDDLQPSQAPMIDALAR